MVSSQINYFEYRNTKIEQWRNKDQWNHKHCNSHRNIDMKLSRIQYIRKTMNQWISSDHRPTYPLKLSDNGYELR